MRIPKNISRKISHDHHFRRFDEKFFDRRTGTEVSNRSDEPVHRRTGQRRNGAVDEPVSTNRAPAVKKGDNLSPFQKMRSFVTRSNYRCENKHTCKLPFGINTFSFAKIISFLNFHTSLTSINTRKDVQNIDLYRVGVFRGRGSCPADISASRSSPEEDVP